MNPAASTEMATTKEIREALSLPNSTNSERVFNAAIRKWMAGGGDLLDAIHHASQLCQRVESRYAAPAEKAFEQLEQIRSRMIAEVREREL